MQKKQLERAKGFHLWLSFSPSYNYSEHCGKFQLCFLNCLRPLEYLRKEVASCNDEIGWVEPTLANCSYAVTWIGHESCPLQVFIVAGYVAGGGYSHDGFPHPNSVYLFFYSVIIAQVTARAYLLLNLPTRTSNSILYRSSNSVIRLLRQECFDGERLRGSGLRGWRGFLLRLPNAWRRFALGARRSVALVGGRTAQFRT